MRVISPSTYAKNISDILQGFSWEKLEPIAEELIKAWREKKTVFLCGNGGSAANANHYAADLIYGIGGGKVPGINAHALSANPSVLSCLGNDEGFDQVFSRQLEACGKAGDLLLVFSGSGNSPNILEALVVAREKGIKTVGFYGFDGGKAKELTQFPVHFETDDMQIAEDLHMIAAHMLSKMCYSSSHKEKA